MAKSRMRDIKREYKPIVSVGLFTGAIFGLMAMMGTYVGNFLWWFQLQHPDMIYINGFGGIILFFALAIILVKVAIKNLSKGDQIIMKRGGK